MQGKKVIVSLKPDRVQAAGCSLRNAVCWTVGAGVATVALNLCSHKVAAMLAQGGPYDPFHAAFTAVTILTGVATAAGLFEVGLNACLLQAERRNAALGQGVWLPPSREP